MSTSTTPDPAPPAEPLEPVVPVLLAAVAGAWHGIALPDVHEVVTSRPFTRLPGAAPEVAGLVNVRGRIVTVLDLGLALGGDAAAAAPGHRVVVLEHGGRLVGLAVEDVLRILRLRPSELDPSAPPAPAHIRATGQADGEPFSLLDTDVLLQPVFT